MWGSGRALRFKFEASATAADGAGLVDSATLQLVVPRLFRFTFDRDGNTRAAMNKLWRIVVCSVLDKDAQTHVRGPASLHMTASETAAAAAAAAAAVAADGPTTASMEEEETCRVLGQLFAPTMKHLLHSMGARKVSV